MSRKYPTRFCTKCSKQYWGRGESFCSRACFASSRRGVAFSEERRRDNVLLQFSIGRRVHLICLLCKKKFTKKKSDIRSKNFCTRACCDEYKKGKRFSLNTEFKVGRKPTARELAVKSLKLRQGYKNGRVSFFEGKIGSKHPNWIKDRNSLKCSRSHAYDTKYKVWMKQVKNRDYWRCQIANGSCSGRVEAHHILGWKDNPELRYKVTNGITLCHAHHPRVRAEEKRLAPFFVELVASIRG